ncbi:MAG: Hpt domain-containing protein [Caldilineaceae bacterium]|nr:Hpt domain-containing protein [Caldilineaceae bacterium]MCB9149835.1 Hpt domain-containing protein [Caldilineaceae bacterium]
MCSEKEGRINAAESKNCPIAVNLIAHLEEMVGFNEPDFLIELLDTYLEDSARTIKLLPQAWQKQNMFDVLRAAHSLKSASATLTAAKLELLTTQLETEMRGGATGLDIGDQIEQIIAEFHRVYAALLIERAKLAKQLS